MSIPQSKAPVSFETYLELEEANEFKSEFYEGVIYDMSGGTPAHSLIATNMGRELGNALMGSDCLVYGSDLKIRVEAFNAGVYPDTSVFCGPLHYYQNRKDTVLNPIVVVEVLSESTEAWDRGGKLRRYLSLESLRAYILVEQREAQVDVFHKTDEGTWVFEVHNDLNKTVPIKSLGIEVPIQGIYHGIDFVASSRT